MYQAEGNQVRKQYETMKTMKAKTASEKDSLVVALQKE